MRKFQIQIFKYTDDPDVGTWHVTAAGSKCTTPEEVIALAKKMIGEHRMKFSRVRAVEVLDEFYGLPKE